MTSPGATHLSIKTLRHYHGIGLLEPADVDPGTGHRRYTADQIATAQVIRRFRSLDMPLEEIQAVIKTPDVATRNALISGHLSRLETTLARTQEAAASLRELLQPPTDCAPVVIEHRQVAATPAAAVREMLDLEEAASWFQGALGELYAIAAAQKLTLSGQAGGIFASDQVVSAPRRRLAQRRSESTSLLASIRRRPVSSRTRRTA